MFRKRDETPAPSPADLAAPATRVTSVLGPGIAWKGAIHGSGGVRVEGAFDGDIHLRGMLVVGEPLAQVFGQGAECWVAPGFDGGGQGGEVEVVDEH